MKKLMVPAAILAAVVMVVSCDKKNDKPANNTLSKIQAKWKIDNVKFDYVGTENDETYTGVAADYVDFRTDGNVYTNIANEKDTSVYKLIGDTKLVVDGDTATIKSLSSNQFIFEYTEDIADDKTTATFTLTK